MSARTDEIKALARQAENEDSRDPWFRTRLLVQAITKLAEEVDALERVIQSRTEHLA